MAEKTPQQQAAELVQQLLGPQIASTQEAARNQGQSAQAAYGAAAEMQQGVAPAIEKTYASATSREAVIAKGLALGAQLAGQETSGASNALLSQQGSPQQVQAGDIGSILSSIGGMSAGNLNREGAAFSAAAQFLPGQSRLLGADAAKAAGSQGATAVGALEAQRPGLVTQARNQILSEQGAAQAAQAAQRNADRTFGLQQDAADLNRVIAASQIDNRTFQQGVDAERLKNERDRIALAKLQSDRTFSLGLDRLGIQDGGLRLRAAELELKRRNVGKPKKGGFTAKQMKDLRADAGALARNAYNGLPESEDLPEGAPPITYQEAIQRALDNGIPLVTVQQALNRYYKRGERGRPLLSLQQRLAADRQAAAAARAKRNRG